MEEDELLPVGAAELEEEEAAELEEEALELVLPLVDAVKFSVFGVTSLCVEEDLP